MKKTPYILIVISFLLVIPSFVFAADNLVLLGQPISCSGVDCDFCNLLELANVVMKFTVYLSILLAAIGFTYVGWTLVTMAGNTGKVDKARQVATSVVIGFVFVLAAWLIVATISQALLRSGKLPWEDIECVDFEPGPDDDDDGDDDVVTGYPSEDEPEDPTGSDPDEFRPGLGTGRYGEVPAEEFEVREQLAASGITVNDAAVCNNPSDVSQCRTYVGGLNQDQIDGLTEMGAEVPEGFVVTGAAEQGGHSANSRHYRGEAVDIRPSPEVNEYIRNNPDQFSRVIDERDGEFGGHWHVEFE